MKTLFGFQDLWETIEAGHTEQENLAQLTQQQQAAVKESRKKDKKAFFMYQAVDEGIFERILEAISSKEAWDTLQEAYKGEEKVKSVRLQALRAEFDLLKMKDSEGVEEYFNRAHSIVNQMKANGEQVNDQQIFEKILRTLTKKYDYIAVAIEESKNLLTLTVNSLLTSLKSHEMRLQQHESTPTEQVFQAQTPFRGGY